jgi:energy-coupling factor transport system ATP-binding protein
VNDGIRLDDWGWRHAGRQAWALRHVNLRVEPGERVLLLGASGAGKSTMLHALAGVLGGADEGESEGRLLVDGSSPVPGGSALGMQDPASQLVSSRIGDDVAFGLENLAVPRDRIWPRVRSALRDVGLNMPLNRSTSRMSGGEQQRLVLAGALAMGANLLLLDEPTANLDPAGVLEVRDAVAGVVADRSRTLIVVEHHSEIWAPLVDRVIILEPGGGVLIDGSPSKIFKDHGPELAQMGVWIPEVFASGTVSSSGFEPSLTDTVGLRSVEQGLPRQAAGGLPRNDVIGVTATVPPSPKPSLRGRSLCDRPRQSIPSSGDGPTILFSEDLSVGYAEPVRSGLDIAIPQGASTVITGPNGIGKSTTALTLAGLLPRLGGNLVMTTPPAPVGRPDPGTWKSKELLTRIGTVFQNPEHQFVASTVFDEVAVGLRALKRSTTEIRERTFEILRRLQLESLAKANPYTLSGGEKRRLSVGTVLAVDPALIVLDEPTFGQDRRTWTELVALIAELRDTGTTILSVTHDAAYIQALGDFRIELGARTGHVSQILAVSPNRHCEVPNTQCSVPRQSLADESQPDLYSQGTAFEVTDVQ